jgi:hypothetical protein
MADFYSELPMLLSKEAIAGYVVSILDADAADPTRDPQQTADQLMEMVTRQTEIISHGAFDAVTEHLIDQWLHRVWSDEPVLLDTLASLVVFTEGPLGLEKLVQTRDTSPCAESRRIAEYALYDLTDDRVVNRFHREEFSFFPALRADSGDVNQDSGGDVNQHRSVATLASLSSGN